MYAAVHGATRLAQELLVHGVDLDALSNQHSALCMAVVNCYADVVNVLLEEYQARGRLREALDHLCLDEYGRPSSLLQHLTTSLHHDPAAQLSTMRVLVSRWGVDIRAVRTSTPRSYLALHESAAKGILPLVKYFIEECGLSVDEPTPGGCHTPLTFACGLMLVSEELLVPVVKYLLETGADATLPTGKGHTAEEIAVLMRQKEIHKLLVSHRRIKQAHRRREGKAAKEVAVDAESFAAKQREADAAAQALLAELDAAEAPSGQKKGKKGKGGSGGKLKKSGGTRQGSHQGEKNKERDEEKEGGTGKENKEGKVDGSRKDGEWTQHDGHEQHGRQQTKEADEAIIAGGAAATHGMSLAEGEGGNSGEPKSSATSAAFALTEDDIFEAAPDEYKCPLEMCLMTEDPVLASDGFMYSKKGLEGWIAHCAAKGLPLTSPKTGEVMDAAFMANKTYRTLVRDWIEKHKAAAQK